MSTIDDVMQKIKELSGQVKKLKVENELMSEKLTCYMEDTDARIIKIDTYLAPTKFGLQTTHSKIEMLKLIGCKLARYINTSETHQDEKSSIICKIQKICKKQINSSSSQKEISDETLRFYDSIFKIISQVPVYWDVKDYKEVSKCGFCENRTRDMMMVPCNHVFFCFPCYHTYNDHCVANHEMLKCPVCMTQVDNVTWMDWNGRQVEIDKKTRKFIPPLFFMSGIYKDVSARFEHLCV